MSAPTGNRGCASEDTDCAALGRTRWPRMVASANGDRQYCGNTSRTSQILPARLSHAKEQPRLSSLAVDVSAILNAFKAAIDITCNEEKKKVSASAASDCADSPFHSQRTGVMHEIVGVK